MLVDKIKEIAEQDGVLIDELYEVLDWLEKEFSSRGLEIRDRQVVIKNTNITL